MSINPRKLDDLEYQTWIVEGGADEVSTTLDAIRAGVTEALGDFATTTSRTVNMWHESQSMIEVKSSRDGSVTVAIHVNPIGSNLFIGRALKAVDVTNYYKLFLAYGIVDSVDAVIDRAAGVHD